jgi:hypothetical protein
VRPNKGRLRAGMALQSRVVIHLGPHTIMNSKEDRANVSQDVIGAQRPTFGSKDMNALAQCSHITRSQGPRVPVNRERVNDLPFTGG